MQRLALVAVACAFVAYGPTAIAAESDQPLIGKTTDLRATEVATASSGRAEIAEIDQPTNTGSANTGTDSGSKGSGGDSSQCGPSNIQACFTAGFYISSAIDADRVSSIKFIQRDDGTEFAQISSNPKVRYGFGGTIGYLAPGFRVYDKQPAIRYPVDFLFCGPFAIFPGPSDDKGCGLILVGAFTTGSSGSFAQVGLGWATDVKFTDKVRFALSTGILVDPSDTVLDKNVIDPNTSLVRPGFETAAKNGSLAGTVNKTTAAGFLALSYEFQ